MTKTDFTDELKNVLQKKLGDKYSIERQNVLKNNNVVFIGISIQKKNKKLAPTIYIDSFYEDYLRGSALEDIADNLISVYKKEIPKGDIDIEFFTNYSMVKKNICFKLINRSKNEELLADIPYIEFLDLAIVFFYCHVSSELGEGSILIRNSHMDMWKCSKDDLLKRAKKNMPKMYPVDICPMGDIIRDLMSNADDNVSNGIFEEEELDIINKEVEMKVITNKKRFYGAASILYDDVLETLADQTENGFYILPSSVHELIFLPYHKEIDTYNLKTTISEVNTTQLLPHEILSEHLYIYDKQNKCLRIHS